MSDIRVGRRTGGDDVRPPKSRFSGDVRRDGAWRVPAEERWQTLFGNVILDLPEE